MQNQIISTISSNSAPDFEVIAERALAGLDSEMSKKQYGYTYGTWQRWCEEQMLHPIIDISLNNVDNYLKNLTAKNGDPATFKTRQNHLSHLRKLVEMLAIYHPAFKMKFDELSFLKTPRAGAGQQERDKQILSRDAVITICKAWDDDDSFRGHRNRALLLLTFSTGARISEVAAAKWHHFGESTLTIPHGKGDKRRVATIVRGLPVFEALEILSDDMDLVTRGYCFPSVKKGGNWGVDKPMSRQAIADVIDETSARTGIKFHHHLARATLATELFREGGEAIIRDVMSQFGWANADTPMKHYIQATSAEKRFGNFRLGKEEK